MEQKEEESVAVQEIWSWGAGTEGQLGTEKLQDEHWPQLLHSLSKFDPISSLSCGGAHVIALTSGGRVLTWGRGTSGQLGHGEMVNSLQPKPLESLGGFVITHVSAGWNHSGFVSVNGCLFTCGDGSFGQLGHGDYDSLCFPEKVSYFNSIPVQQIACGMRHSLALIKDDVGYRVYGFGSGKRGQLGVSMDKVRLINIPQATSGLEDVTIVSIHANGDHSAALSGELSSFIVECSLYSSISSLFVFFLDFCFSANCHVRRWTATIHCWVPKTRKPNRPNLVLIHGFGINGMWQWWETVRILTPNFNVYVPDLVFFGDSFTTRPERSESFQAQCIKRVMDANSVEKMSVVGISYGGFVAYSMAAQFGESVVEKVVICCSGVCLEEKDIREGLFPVKSVEEAADILVPLKAEKLKELMNYTFVKPPKGIPACLLEDFIDEMCSRYVKEKKELLFAISKDRKLSDIPRITQPTLILWGDQDQIFPVELAHRLKGHLGENAKLVVIEGTGHAIGFEKPKDYHKHLKNFLLS